MNNYQLQALLLATSTQSTQSSQSVPLDQTPQKLMLIQQLSGLSTNMKQVGQVLNSEIVSQNVSLGQLSNSLTQVFLQSMHLSTLCQRHLFKIMQTQTNQITQLKHQSLQYPFIGTKQPESGIDVPNIRQQYYSVTSSPKMMFPQIDIQKFPSEKAYNPNSPYNFPIGERMPKKFNPIIVQTTTETESSIGMVQSTNLDLQETQFSRIEQKQKCLKGVSPSKPCQSEESSHLTIRRIEIKDPEISKHIPANVNFVMVIPGSSFNHDDSIKCLKKYDHENIRPTTSNYSVYKFHNPQTARERKILKCGFKHCEKVFTKFHNFYDHLRCHTGEKPFACTSPGCEMTFSQKSNLKKHLSKTHRGCKVGSKRNFQQSTAPLERQDLSSESSWKE